MADIFLTALKAQVDLMGQDIVQFIRELLYAHDKEATSNLVNSVSYKTLWDGNNLLLDILASDYFKYVNDGRKPGSRPPPVKAILPWVEAKGIQFTNKKGTIIPTKSTAFIIARSIGIKGIKPTNIRQQAIIELLKNKQVYLEKGVNLDVMNYLNKIFPKK